MTTTIVPSPPELNTLRLEVDGEIGTLTLDRPEVLNAMSPELIGELVVAAAWLADRAPLRALIVTGAGRAFSSGGDVNWFKRGLEESGADLSAEVRRGADVLHQEIVEIERFGMPVVNALAAGEISLHADMLAHGSSPNRSDRRRCGLTVRYCPPTVRPLDAAWGRQAILCRGQDQAGNWTHNPRPERDELTPASRPRSIGAN